MKDNLRIITLKKSPHRYGGLALMVENANKGGLRRNFYYMLSPMREG